MAPVKKLVNCSLIFHCDTSREIVLADGGIHTSHDNDLHSPVDLCTSFPPQMLAMVKEM